jgi:hypothetical protein
MCFQLEMVKLESLTDLNWLYYVILYKFLKKELQKSKIMLTLFNSRSDQIDRKMYPYMNQLT